MVIISSFLLAATRSKAIVPGRLQFAGEGIYTFVRNTLGRDVIGSEFLKFVPLLFSIFCFILVNNIFGVIPL
ncbi:MAG: F0F1 ATP synthase subunit A, partial [Actinomycetota bacterium]